MKNEKRKKLIALLDPENGRWRDSNTYGGDLFSEQSELYSKTWPISGMTQDGRLYELPTPELRINDSESSSSPIQRGGGGVDSELTLPTPTAVYPGGTAQQHLNRKPGRKVVTDLRMITEENLFESGGELPTLRTPRATRGGSNTETRELLLPTPNTMEHLPAREGAAYEKALRRGDMNGSRRNQAGNLREAVIHDLLPTVTTQDAKNNGSESQQRRDTKPLNAEVVTLPTPTTSDGNGVGEHGTGSDDLRTVVTNELLPTPKAGDGDFGLPRTSGRPPEKSTHLATRLHFTDFGKYEPAIQRWERVLGWPAPPPTEPTGRDGAQRLSSKFTEWMMGLPHGWVTGWGLTRSEELKACGNGVVPQQAVLALRHLLSTSILLSKSFLLRDPRSLSR